MAIAMSVFDALQGVLLLNNKHLESSQIGVRQSCNVANVRADQQWHLPRGTSQSGCDVCRGNWPDLFRIRPRCTCKQSNGHRDGTLAGNALFGESIIKRLAPYERSITLLCHSRHFTVSILISTLLRTLGEASRSPCVYRFL